MPVKKGDKIQLIKPMGSFTNVGEICEVIKVDDIEIKFRFGGLHLGVMSHDELNEYFRIYKEPKPEIKSTVSEDYIWGLLKECFNNQRFKIQTVFGKCTIVAVQLANGFVIVESSACVDPKNYNLKTGIEICIDKIKNKLYELEGYKLQSKNFEVNNENEYSGCEEDEEDYKDYWDGHRDWDDYYADDEHDTNREDYEDGEAELYRIINGT